MKSLSNFISESGEFLPLLLFLLATLILAIIWRFYVHQKANKNDLLTRFNTLNENSKLIVAAFDQFEQLTITPIEYNRMLKEPCTNMNIFRLIFLDLMRRKILYINENMLYIDTEKFHELKKYERQFIDILIRFINFDTYDNKIGISLTEFINSLLDKHKQILLAVKKVIKIRKVPKKNRSLYQDAYMLKAHFNSYAMNYTKSTSDIFEYHKRNHAIDLKVLYCLASSTPITYKKPTYKSLKGIHFKAIDPDDFYAQLAFVLDNFSAKYVNKFAAIFIDFLLDITNIKVNIEVDRSIDCFSHIGSSDSGSSNSGGCGGGGAD